VLGRSLSTRGKPREVKVGEVRDLSGVLIEQADDVFRFDVTVDNVVVVRMFDRLGDVDEQVHLSGAVEAEERVEVA
jgi:hypothetical protein